MPISDAELQTLHDSTTDGQLKELLGELIQARQALPVAQKISQMGTLLDSYLFALNLQEPDMRPEEVLLAIIRRKEDGTGRVGPAWPLGEFHQDLKTLAELLLDQDQQMDLKAAAITSIFDRG